jgi:hypothetical protein
MKLSTIVQSVAPSLQALGGMKLPVKASFRVGTALTAIKPVMENFEKSRMGLFEQFGILDEKQQTYSVPDAKLPDFNKQFAALIEEDCAVTLPKIKLSEMGDVSIEPHHLAALADMFVDE